MLWESYESPTIDKVIFGMDQFSSGNLFEISRSNEAEAELSDLSAFLSEEIEKLAKNMKDCDRKFHSVMWELRQGKRPSLLTRKLIAQNDASLAAKARKVAVLSKLNQLFQGKNVPKIEDLFDCYFQQSIECIRREIPHFNKSRLPEIMDLISTKFATQVLADAFDFVKSQIDDFFE